MKTSYWALVMLSAIMYALPFLWSDQLWWLIFVFSIPLLYLTRIQDLSFIHGYVWGIIVFFLHLSGGIAIMVRLAHESWCVGSMLGILMVLYQALVPALLFWCAASIIRFLAILFPIARLLIWTAALALFIFWTDQYCLWIFGIQEGYPLMHPLVPLMQQPSLLLLLPIIGKQALTILFLLVPSSFVLLLWNKNNTALFFFICAIIPWVLCYLIGLPEAPQPH